MLSTVGTLLVYIPTYNRPGLLSSQLESLAPQVRKYQGRVQVVVADNASPDLIDQQELARLSSESWFTYLRRPVNIMGNANILLGFTRLTSDGHLWILSDDTTVRPDAIDHLMNAIESGAGFIATSEDCSVPEKRSVLWERGRLNQILSEENWGLISSVIYSGRFFLDSVPAAFFFHNSSFPHLGVLLSALKQHGRLDYMAIPRRLLFGDNEGIGSTNYGLAVSGLPHLFTLVGDEERKELLVSWLRKYAAAFAYYRRTNELSALATYQMIRSAGLRANLHYLMGALEVMVRETRFGQEIERYVEAHPKLMRLLLGKQRIPFRRD